eukprot:gnl/TRDRNA2_/TRDRNA2_137575_c0_seq2.p1 gnl/TRDRNA2_/TRDRNA2_137575_c0~~gnl/TRDRNA2_/TRDRNA2_137575_c0_seq2.p1  ORF type:complete len:369 (-),score=49.23 gnl/TRDRNA2_/TRDRNA2_137575_c0_seq2:93-1199(-)
MAPERTCGRQYEYVGVCQSEERWLEEFALGEERDSEQEEEAPHQPHISDRKVPCGCMLKAILPIAVLVALGILGLVRGSGGSLFRISGDDQALIVRDTLEKGDLSKPERMRKRVTDYLNLEVLDCADGIQRMDQMHEPYFINVMLTTIGTQAKACSIQDTRTQGRAPHEHDGRRGRSENWCVIYSGDEGCPAAWVFMKHSKHELKKNCDHIVYLKAGARCLLENKLPLEDRDKCSNLVVPHTFAEFSQVSKKLNMVNIQCKDFETKMKTLDEPFVINAMYSGFGKHALGCNPINLEPHNVAPSEYQDQCVIFCGESYCPFRLTFVRLRMKWLKENCGELFFVVGGAQCFLQQHVPLRDREECAEIAIG